MGRYSLDCNTYLYTSNQLSSNSAFLGLASHMMGSRKMRQLPKIGSHKKLIEGKGGILTRLGVKNGLFQSSHLLFSIPEQVKIDRIR
jgi:hypothetical protein